MSTLEHNSFLQLLLITALAFFVPILANRLRRFSIPIVVGEIFAGILIGKSGFNIIEPSPILNFLAEFGFVFLMFLSGLEVDFDVLIPRERRKSINIRQPLPLSLVVLGATIGLAILFSLILRGLGIVQSPLLMGLILSTTSLGVVVPVLKERKLLGSDYGQLILVAASLADFVILLLVTIFIAVRSQGLTLDLLLIPVLLLAFIIAVRITQLYSGHRLPQRILRELSSATAQIRVRGAFALMVAWVVLAEALGVEIILGAFLAGAVAGLVASSDDDDAQEKLDAIGYGFFIPVFFIMVGVEFNLQALFESPRAMLLVPLLVVGAYAVKVVPALLMKVSTTWRQAIGGGFLLASHLSLIIATASIALRLGLITEAVDAAIILLALISCTLSPLLFNRIYPPEEEQRRNGIIIIGQDQLVEFIVERLLPTEEPITVICPDESRIQAFEALPVGLITGCTSLDEALNEVDAGNARVLFDLTSTPAETLEVSTLARKHHAIPLVISRISDVELIPKLQDMGVKVVQPALATAMALEGALRFPTIFDLLLSETRQDIDVSEVVFGSTRLAGTTLGRLRLPGDTLILSIQRDESVIVPNGDTVLQLGDRIGLIGSPRSLSEAISLLRR
jgi:Kef-type K+ transport system membrane component KefB/Trk K+ transport system NAD-binding subunit